MFPAPLPVDEHVPAVVAAVRKHRRLVVVAPPGAGKTTRIPPALVDDGPVILLQPRRVAARALARRIASERGWSLGDEVGWHVRFERNFTKRTKLLVATEGILTARFQSDPLLADFRTIVLDEFHERSIHADLALGLAREALEARDDLRLVVMSATLDAERVATFLDCPVIRVESRLYPVDISYAPGSTVADAARNALASSPGDVLCFLPGMREIREVHAALEGHVDAEIHDLHGSLDADAQDAAIAPSTRRRIILATNVAETSLTVEGVSTVVDSGLHRLIRFDASIALDRLETERISADSAEQRAGRAGRLGPGGAIRLWDARDHLDPHREPEISRIDLAATLLEVIAWGDDPSSFGWFESPPEEHVAHGLELLALLGAIEGSPPRLTAVGRLLERIPLHPRLGRLLLATGCSRDGARVAAILSEGSRLGTSFDLGSAAASTSDSLAMLDRFSRAPRGVRRAADEIERLAGRDRSVVEPGDRDEQIRRALLRAYPDRVARRREPESDRLLMAAGTGAVLARESTVRRGEWLVALDVMARRGAEALVRTASTIEKEWLEPTRTEVVHEVDARGNVRAYELLWYFEVEVGRRTAKVDPVVAEEILFEALRTSIDDVVPALLRNRIAFAGIEVGVDEAMRSACVGRTSLPRFNLLDWLSHEARRDLARLAPETIEIPTGRRARLDYRDDGSAVASVKLQDLFGLEDSPRIGPNREPILFALLAPNGRPVQMTRDLRNFWDTTYADVRKELRGRYPKHKWPEDPRRHVG